MLGICLVAAVARSDQARLLLTNEDITQLVRAGFDESLVLQAVDIHDTRFDLSPEAIATLKRAGVRENVIVAMQSKASAKRRTRESLLEPGVYAKRGDTYVDVPTETVNWLVVSASGQVAGTAIDRWILSGRIERAYSPLRLRGPIELLLVSPASVSPSEYRLLRADESDDWREFRAEAALSGGVLLALGGDEKHRIGADIDKSFDLGVRLWLGILRNGQYGLTPPGLMENGHLTAMGRMYTFTVD